MRKTEAEREREVKGASVCLRKRGVVGRERRKVRRVKGYEKNRG